MTESVNFNIPLKGRFVSGDMTQTRQKDYQGKPIEPNKQRVEFGIAYPKAEFWNWLTQTFYPGPLAQALAGQGQAMQLATAWFQNGFNGFSMKIDDGDKPNARGGINENTKGCFVVYFNAINPPQVYVGATPETLTQVDTSECKRGYYIMMSGNIRFNEKMPPQIGIYMNAGAVWLVEKGAEIVGGIDAASAFAGVALPPGMAPVDLSNGAGAAFGAPPMPQMPQMPGMPPMQQAAPAMPGFPGAPAPVQMAPVGLPGQASMPPAAPPQTAFPGSAPVAPYYGAMQPGQPPAAAPLPGLPGLPGLPQ